MKPSEWSRMVTKMVWRWKMITRMELITSSDETVPIDDSTTLGDSMDGAAHRLLLWDPLSRLAPSVNTSWILGGDFNAILQSEERIGGSLYATGQVAINGLNWEIVFGVALEYMATTTQTILLSHGLRESKHWMLPSPSWHKLIADRECCRLTEVAACGGSDASSFGLAPQIAELLSRSWEVRLEHVSHVQNKVADGMARRATFEDLVCRRYFDPRWMFSYVTC
ncbi:hypothetical protein V6N12_068888 [Hibiscus sabdariffa]|uniref:RNase H type-1 domain-containing protein n=1 Tax=Hibiscus sabdariffa TaxID=183260 RepID=A0ABR2CA25_9ROSI